MFVVTQNFIWALLSAFLTISVLKAAPRFPENSPGDDELGFLSLFDGETLSGWGGDPVYWKVEDGSIVGEVRPDTLLERNSFLIYQGDVPANFELKVQYRVSERGNSGVQYRSEAVQGVPWALEGYQADIDGRGRWTGQNYEERGRTFLAKRGQVTRVESGGSSQIIGSVGEEEALWQYVKTGDWNEYHIIADGYTLTHILNGQVMSVVIDNDVENRRADGILGVQVHVGPPMKIEYKNIRIRSLSGSE